MSAPPTVSVLMTARNRERYVGAAIRSVLAQTLTDFELLVVDDASSDGTVEVARRLARTDGRIRVVVNERNLGDYPNRNRAAALARGRLLKYHDSDDVMYPHCLATMAAALASEPRAGLALTGSRSWSGGPTPMLLTPRMSYQREFLGAGLFQGGPSCGMFRTEVFRELGGFPEKGVGSDYLFWLEACAQVDVVLVPGDLFWWRVHPGQEIQNDKAQWEYALLPGEAWRRLGTSSCPLDAEERKRARRNLTSALAKLTYVDLRAGRFRLARHRLRQAALSWSDWLRYPPRSRRDLRAGTPLGQDGDYVMPAWLDGVTERGDREAR